MTKPYRLPAHAWPDVYELHLRARVDEPSFTGTLRIHGRLVESTRRIELHARDLHLSSAHVRGLPVKVEPDAEREMVALLLAEDIPAGPLDILIEYEGKVSSSMEGLYLSKDGAEVCLATQCEETDARGIFPCFDEPAYKARFRVSVTTTPDVVVLANGPLEAKLTQEGVTTWRFAETKPMSSYLFALAVGAFASTPERLVRGTPLRVHALHGKEKLGDYGNEFAARLLPFFEDYFGAQYHFDKYDQIAVPSFSAGAMENSGLVIFRQTLLLRDPKTTSWTQEKTIAKVIAHEFAHQWFGNLVTMAWWDDIWLNESFAEWMAHRAADAVAPDYHVWADFHDNKRGALVTDALVTTHPIYTPVETPEQATELFDTVTYSKGSVLMRMIERFLGEDAFRAGLRTYMQEFAEANAKGDDLWRHLGAASGQPVTTLAQSWILQPGYPLVSVALEGTQLKLTQSRFFSDPKAPAGDQTWAIPLTIRYADAAGVHELRHLFDARESLVFLPIGGTLRWLHVNAEGVGFYRQALSADLSAKLVAHVGELSASEQRDLLDDTWALVRAEKRPMSAFLEVLTPIVHHARDHHVIAEAASALDGISELLEEGPEAATARPAFRAWTASLFAGEARRLGYAPREGEPRDDSERRAHVLRAMARHARDEEALAAAVDLADREIVDPTQVDATLAGPAVALAARVGDAARHAQSLATFDARRKAGAPPALVQRHLTSLALYEDPALLARTLTLMEEGRFAIEALGPMLRTMLNEPHARVPAWRWMKANWSTIRERLGDMWTGFLVENTGHLPASQRADLVRFLDANLHGVAQQSYARALEALDTRTAFEARTRPEVVAWLKAK